MKALKNEADFNYLDKLKETYNAIAEKYDALRDSQIMVPELEKFISMLDGDHILDAGCGPGRDCSYFSLSGLDVCGIDISKRFIVLAKKKAPKANIREMSILNLEFEQKTFDGIWCCVVLSHLKKEHFKLALSEFHRVLKQKGILFCVVKAGKGQRIVREEVFDNRPRFTSYYLESEIRNYLKDTNFDILQLYKFNERERHGDKHRDLEFFVVFSTKEE